MDALTNVATIIRQQIAVLPSTPYNHVIDNGAEEMDSGTERTNSSSTPNKQASTTGNTPASTNTTRQSSAGGGGRKEVAGGGGSDPPPNASLDKDGDYTLVTNKRNKKQQDKEAVPPAAQQPSTEETIMQTDAPTDEEATAATETTRDHALTHIRALLTPPIHRKRSADETHTSQWTQVDTNALAISTIPSALQQALRDMTTFGTYTGYRVTPGIGHGTSVNSFDNNRSEADLTTFLQEQRPHVFIIQAHATAHDWFDCRFFPEIIISYRMSLNPIHQGDIHTQALDEWIKSVMARVAQWEESPLRKLYTDYMMYARQWVHGLTEMTITADIPELQDGPITIDLHPLAGWLFIQLFAAHGPMTAYISNSRLSYVTYHRQWTPRLFDNTDDLPHFLNMNQLQIWQSQGCPVITHHGPMGWRLGLPSTGHANQLRSLLLQFTGQLQARLTSSPLLTPPRRRNTFLRESGQASVRSALLSQLNEITVDIPHKHGTLHARLHMTAENMETTIALLQQHPLDVTNEAPTWSGELRCLQVTLSPSTTWTYVANDYSIFRALHMLLGYHRLQCQIGSPNYGANPRDRAQLANYLDTINLHYSDRNRSQDQQVLIQQITEILPILRARPTPPHRPDGIDAQGRIHMHTGRSNPTDLHTHLTDALEVFSPHSRQPGITIWRTDSTATTLSWYQTSHTTSNLTDNGVISPLDMHYIMMSASYVNIHMEADNTHSAISISPTVIEIAMGRKAINTLIAKALLLVQEHAPPPPITQIASLSLTGDTKKPRSDTREPDRSTQSSDNGPPSVNSTQDISSITHSHADGPDQEEDLGAEQTSLNQEQADLIEALHPTIYDICTNLLLVSGIPTDMMPDTVLLNIGDILTYYEIPFDAEALRSQLDFEWEGSLLKNVRTSPGNQPTGSLLIQLLRECSFGTIHDSRHDRFPRFISESTYIFSSIRNGKDVAYSTILYFNPIREADVDAVTHPHSRLLTVRGGVGHSWTDICLLNHLHNIQKELTTGPIVIHAECVRRGQKIPSARADNSKSPALPKRREWKHGHDVVYMIYSTGPNNTWHNIRETLRSEVTSRCYNKDDSNWRTEAGPGITLLGMCPAIWKACPLLYFECYSPIYDFDCNAFLTMYCYPHHLRGDDRVVTLFTITGVHTLNGSTTPLTAIAPPTVPELLQLLADAYINLDYLAFVINMPPIHTFMPSSCMYGNSDPSSANHKHRYAIIWKDGVERMLPVTLRTSLATFTFSASLEPGHNLPGFWTTEHTTPRSKFYNGMLRALYTTYTTSGHNKIKGDHNIPGLRPSPRWYEYRQNMPLATSAASSPSIRQERGGRGTTRKLNPPGRGHTALPHDPNVRAGSVHITTLPPASSSSPTELVPRSNLTTAQQFEQIMNLCQTSLTETRGVRTELSNDREHQARINEDLRTSLARAHAAIDALNSQRGK
jgi:hypothetical protein